MRVFVIGTGRCGSVTFAKACEHIANYTCGHEEVFTKAPADTLDWPDQHIAVEPSIWPLMPLLRERYPELVIVHLLRTDRETFIRSYRRLDSPRFIGAAEYRLAPEDRPRGYENWEGAPPTIDVWSDCHIGTGVNEAERLENIGIYYDAVNAWCRAMGPIATVRLEQAKQDWPYFWQRIRAMGDFVASRDEWDRHHNTQQERDEKAGIHE